MREDNGLRGAIGEDGRKALEPYIEVEDASATGLEILVSLVGGAMQAQYEELSDDQFEALAALAPYEDVDDAFEDLTKFLETHVPVLLAKWLLTLDDAK